MPSPSLLTVTLNPAVDKTYVVPGFTLGGVNRPQEIRLAAGGKGINAARVYGALGGRATATGFLGGKNGEYLSSEMAREGIENLFLPIAGETRVCIKIIDPKAGTQTEVNEAGPELNGENRTALFAQMRELLPGRSAVVFTGSIPPSLPLSLYRDLVALAQDEFDVPAVLDASGEALRMGLEARPFLVKPNRDELRTLGIAGDSLANAAKALYEGFQPTLALVTAGAHGAAVWGADGGWEAMPPTIVVASAVGSGDALAAGFLLALHTGRNIGDALAVGVGAGAANAETYEAGQCQRARIMELAAQTVVRQAGD